MKRAEFHVAVAVCSLLLALGLSTSNASAQGGTPTVHIEDAQITEAGNTGHLAVEVKVRLSHSRNQQTYVGYTVEHTAGSTATEGSNNCNWGEDYIGITQSSLTFSGGSTEESIWVTICNDPYDEQNPETFQVRIHEPTNLNIDQSRAVATVSVFDDDSPPRATVGNVSVSEGNAGQTNANFTVNLTQASGQVVRVNYETQQSSSSAATQGTSCSGSTDYLSRQGFVEFQPGEESKTVAVPVCGDTQVESNEFFRLRLTTAENATLSSGNVATGTIQNDDQQAEPAPATVRIYNAKVMEGSILSFTVVLSQAQSSPVTMYYYTRSGTASGGTSCSSTSIYDRFSGTTDYVTIPKSRAAQLRFDPGQTKKTIKIPTCGDTRRESSETFYVYLYGISGATFSDYSAAGVIVNND